MQVLCINLGKIMKHEQFWKSDLYKIKFSDNKTMGSALFEDIRKELKYFKNHPHVKQIEKMIVEGNITKENLNDLAKDNFAKLDSFQQVIKSDETYEGYDDYKHDLISLCPESCLNLMLIIQMTLVGYKKTYGPRETGSLRRFGTFLANFADACEFFKCFT